MPLQTYYPTKIAANKVAAVDSNELTIASYSRNALNYIKSTSCNLDDYSPTMREWIDDALSFVPRNGRIVELGTAVLRDASYIRSQGFNIICSDAAEGFVSMLNRQGEPARILNVLKDEFESQYDMVFANGVFPHFTPSQAWLAFRNIHDALEPASTLALSIKLGEGETFQAEKFSGYCFTHLWSKHDFLDLAAEAGFHCFKTSSNRGFFPSHNWLNVILRT